LRYATTQGRAVYSLNVSDFTRIHTEFLSRGEEHAGMIMIPRQRYAIGEKIRRLQELLEATDAESLRNTIRFV
jgi:hypothetical protein